MLNSTYDHSSYKPLDRMDKIYKNINGNISP